jgi:hypothetical protein
MMRYSPLLLLVLTLLSGPVGCDGGKISLPSQVTAPEKVDSNQALLATLDIAPDGTLYFSDSAKAHAILGSSWTAAVSDLAALNKQIRSGQVQPFKSKDELLKYSPHTAPLNQSMLEEASGESSAQSTNSDPRNPQCKDGECNPYIGLCCCRGWWIFCWDHCACTP